MVPSTVSSQPLRAPGPETASSADLLVAFNVVEVFSTGEAALGDSLQPLTQSNHSALTQLILTLSVIVFAPVEKDCKNGAHDVAYVVKPQV